MFHIEFKCADRTLASVLRLLDGKVYDLSSRPLENTPRPLENTPESPAQKIRQSPGEHGGKTEAAKSEMRLLGTFNINALIKKGFHPSTVRRALLALNATKQSRGHYTVETEAEAKRNAT